MEIKEYSIQSDDLEVKFLNLGAIITEINYKGINRVLRFEQLESYLDNTMFLGSIVGRTAGRIKDGKFETGQLPKNFLNKHNLHGNKMNLSFYDIEIINKHTASLKVTDLEGDYPGNLELEVRYTIENNCLHQEIIGDSDKSTLINMTNHTYFNLNGQGSMLNHKLKIDANKVGILDKEMLTIGFKEVGDTAFDFRQERLISSALQQGDEQFKISGFIDHPFKLDGKIELTGLDCKMIIETNQPYVVGYFGSQIENEKNMIRNNQIENYVALCLETQKCPGDIELVSDYYSSTRFFFC